MKAKSLAPALVALLLTGACGPAPVPPLAEGNSFGHFEVGAEHPDLAGLQEPLRVEVAGVAGYAVRREGEAALRFTVQGAPAPGRYPVVVRGRGGAIVELGDVDYAPLAHPAFDRVVAMGASLTMGIQDAGLTPRSQLHGPASQLARALGVFLPPPLAKEGYLPSLVIADFDPETCALPPGDNPFTHLASRAMETLLPKITDSDGNIRIARARVDPALETRNVAIGGFRLSNVLRGASDVLAMGMEHFVWNPNVDPAGLIDSPAQKMMDRVEAMAPTLVVSTDLFGNDYTNVDLSTDGVPDLVQLTSIDSFRTDLKEILDRLQATGAQVILATGPDVTLLPGYDRKVQALRAAGFSEADATGWRDAIRQRIRDYNAELLVQLEGRPGFHVVDFHARTEEIFRDGIVVGDLQLTPKPMGGILSLDGMHFSDTGYALLANELLREVNRALGTGLAEIDVAKVMAEDPYSVANLRAAGLPCAGL